MGREDMGEKNNSGARPALASDQNLFQPDPIPGTPPPIPQPINSVQQMLRDDVLQTLGL